MIFYFQLKPVSNALDLSEYSGTSIKTNFVKTLKSLASLSKYQQEDGVLTPLMNDTCTLVNVHAHNLVASFIIFFYR